MRCYWIDASVHGSATCYISFTSTSSGIMCDTLLPAKIQQSFHSTHVLCPFHICSPCSSGLLHIFRRLIEQRASCNSWEVIVSDWVPTYLGQCRKGLRSVCLHSAHLLDGRLWIALSLDILFVRLLFSSIAVSLLGLLIESSFFWILFSWFLTLTFFKRPPLKSNTCHETACFRCFRCFIWVASESSQEHQTLFHWSVGWGRINMQDAKSRRSWIYTRREASRHLWNHA